MNSMKSERINGKASNRQTDKLRNEQKENKGKENDNSNKGTEEKMKEDSG